MVKKKKESTTAGTVASDHIAGLPPVPIVADVAEALARNPDTLLIGIFFFKQKPAYEITYGDWSSDVCSSDLDDFQKEGVLHAIITHCGSEIVTGDERE